MFHKFFSDRQFKFWRFFIDTKIFFGREETVEKFPEIVNILGKRIGVLTDDNVSRLSFTKKYLSKIEEKIVSTQHIGFQADYDDVVKAADVFREKKVDVIVAIGGGSVIDGAKAVSVFINNSMKLSELEAHESLKNKKIPVVAIPTTFGTGSEVDLYIFVNDKKNKLTISFKKDFLMPDATIINPDVMKETPAHIKYMSGIDAFLHNLEVLTLKREKSPIQDMLVSNGVNLFLENFRAYIENPHEENEDAVAFASLLGGIGVNNSRPGLIHSLAKGFAKYFKVSHPASLIPFVIPAMRLNWGHIKNYFNNIPFEDFENTLNEKIFFLKIKKLEDIKINDDIIDKMTEVCLKDTVIIKENPAPLNKEVFKGLFASAFSEAFEKYKQGAKA